MKHWRLVWSSLCLFIALWAVLTAPTSLFWIIAIIATEWGHYLAAASLLIFWPGWRDSRANRFAAGLAAVACCLALTSIVRAERVARALPEQISQALGEKSAISSGPLSLTEMLLGAAMPRLTAETMTYTSRAGQVLKLDLYRRDSGGMRMPLIVVIHGGSWRSGDRKELADINYYLAAHGFVVASVDYRLGPQFPFPAAANDVKDAILFLKTHAGALAIDPEKIVMLGRSAGGQLALEAAYTFHDPSIRGVIAFYAPNDLEFAYSKPSNPRVLNSREILESYLGGPPSASGKYAAASPLNFVGASTVPTLMIHGGRDELVWSVHSERLDEKLTKFKRPHFYLLLPWATHGCDFNFSGPCGQLSTYAVLRFLHAVAPSIKGAP